jgi:hypothetical protein
VAGIVSPKPKPSDPKTAGGRDRADYCKFKIIIRQNANSWRWDFEEARDGKLENWESKPANDKWNFDPDDITK